MRVAPEHVRGFWKENRRQILFALGWFMFIFLVFALGRVFRPRYLLPSHPLLAAVFGGAIMAILEAPRMRSAVERCRSWGFALAVTFGIVVGLVGARFDPRFPLAGAAIVAIALLVLRAPRSTPSVVTGMCLWIFGVLWSYDAFLRPVFAETPTAAFAASLESVPESIPVFSVGIPYRVEAQLAVLSKGRHIPRKTSAIDPSQDNRPIFILSEPRFGALPAGLYMRGVEVQSYRNVNARLFIESWKGKSREALLAERRRTFVLALPTE
jgi:hypothetical protein